MPQKTNILRALLPLLLALPALFTSCQYERNDDHWVETNQVRPDSTDFRATHHYWRNFNFMVTDSLPAHSRAPFEPQLTFRPDTSINIAPGDVLVVEEIRADTAQRHAPYWVRVTALSMRDTVISRSSITSGWVTESSLLERAVPNTPISKFIRQFSDSRIKIALLGIVLFGLLLLIQRIRRRNIRLVHFADIGSFYPTLFCLCVAATAVIYQTMQVYAPDTWVEFYFHPTLNPFSPTLPLILSIFVAAVWGLLLIAIAVVDDVRQRLNFTDALAYLAGLGAISLLLYLFFTQAVPILLAYPILALYWSITLIRYLRRDRGPQYLCGQCGAPLTQLGPCPHCGATNRE